MEEKERVCNFLETLFVTENVRFVVGVELSKHANVTRVQHALHDSLYQCGAHVRVMLEGNVAHLVRNTTSDADSTLVVEPLMGRSLQEIVRDNMLSNAGNEGPARLTTYGNDKSDVKVIVININHALFDAITIKSVLSFFSDRLEDDEEPFALREQSFASMQDWGSLLQPHTNSLSSFAENQVPYLPVPKKPLSIVDILGASSDTRSDNSRDVIVCLSSDTVKRCLTKARAQNTTLTGLWISSLFWSLAECYFQNHPGNESCCLAVSVLVDLRRMLPEQQHNMLQVQAAVTIGRIVKACEITSDDIDALKWLWNVARDSTLDMRRRIERGEAHRQAICFSSGRMNEACPVEASVELSNHGIYQVPCASSIEVSQRFDGYQGCSVIVHSESSTGVMKGTASTGNNVSHDGIVLLMNRIERLFQLVASSE